MNVYNPNPADTATTDNVTFLIICVLEGSFTITQLGAAQSQIGVISSSDILDSHSQIGISLSDANDVLGLGNFYSGFKNLGNKVVDAAKKTNNFLRENKIISQDC